MKATLVAVFFMFGSVMMVIAVAPVVIEETSGRSSDAGFVTAVFAAATVLTDLALPRLLHTRTASWLLAIGIVVIGASAPLFAVGSDNVAVMLAASAVRGVGFALGSVTASLFVINLAPEAQRGRALGFYGVAATVPQSWPRHSASFCSTRSASGRRSVSPVCLAFWAPWPQLEGAASAPSTQVKRRRTLAEFSAALLRIPRYVARSS